MLYFLLTIIAVGVLLLSEEGRSILKILMGFLTILVVVLVCGLIVFCGVLFFSSEKGKELVEFSLKVLAYLLLFMGGLGFLIFVAKRIGYYWRNKQQIPSWIKIYWTRQWRDNRWSVILLGIFMSSFLGITGMTVMGTAGMEIGVFGKILFVCLLLLWTASFFIALIVHHYEHRKSNKILNYNQE